MNDKNKIKIGDFDISKYFKSNKEYTETLNKTGSIYYIAPEILSQGIFNKKSDMYSLGCIIYELFNLSIYYNDRENDEIKKIDSKIYNYKWQEIIDSLLEIDYNKSMKIDKIYDIISNEIKINELENKINNININNEIEDKYLNNKNIIDESEKNEIEKTNKIYDILPENEKSASKLCKKCGEMYQILGELQRQGDGKIVPRWWVLGKSGKKEPKEGIETCVLRSFFIQFEPWIWDYSEDEFDGDEIFNCISHYDDKALGEIDNGNCIMKGCDGKLCNIKFNRKPFINNL